jgi:glutamate formiminotransferase / formiminotetrahydrofolate cyclodeaminase
MKIIECVPNFSNGRDKAVIDQIVEAIKSVEGAMFLDAEMDADHNRAVLTYVGEPEPVAEAAFRACKKAMELIDLNHHKGEHPRMGATDVIPFIPVRGATMDDCVELARKVGRRIGEELGIPIYLYEAAATREDRKQLPNVRKGEFEGLREVIGKDQAHIPDFGPNKIHPTAGATAVGARPFLIAYNIYLDTNKLEVAENVAKAIRGISGGFEHIRALGFEIKERGCVQVSMNMTNYKRSALHQAFENVKMEAARYGVNVLESELVGLTPLKAIQDVAEWYLRFPKIEDDQIIENRLLEGEKGTGKEESLVSFMDRLASSKPTPGGGSASALAGSLAACLAGMVARLTAKKKDYENVKPQVIELIDQASLLRDELWQLVERDAQAFDDMKATFKLPDNDPEKKIKVEKACQNAAFVPLETMQKCLATMEVANQIATIGFHNSVSDAGVANWMAFSGIQGAGLNVKINIPGINDKKVCDDLLKKSNAILADAENLVKQTQEIVLKRISQM